MRRLSSRNATLLRLAVRLVLALVLCLNGFFAPVAMAHHAVGMAQAAAEQAAEHGSSCHESDADTADLAASTVQPADHGGKHDSCCKQGECLCGCILAANVPASFVASVAPADTRTALPLALHVADSRYSVPLRPPIV